MILMKYVTKIITICFILVNCSSNKDIPYENHQLAIYNFAQKKLKLGNYDDAIKALEILNNHYPFNPYAKQVQLDLITAHYKSNNLMIAKTYIDRFLRLNPTHPNIDYVLYIRGLTNIAMDENALQKFFGIDRSDRNPEYVRAAFYDLVQLIQNYPNSKYVIDASKHLVYLTNRLAEYELSIVKYYSQRGAYVAVINRVEQMLIDFPKTKALNNALFYMETAYRKLNLINQAEKVSKIIAMNSP